MKASGFADGTDPRRYIVVRGARQHNLKSLNLDLPKQRINVITGPSGSGKSSLAFNTIFAEGQRRYMESLSAYARQFLVRMDKPEVDYLGGLAPAVAIEQKALVRNPRSTVATQTEIYDHLRLLYAQVGTTFSPVSGQPVTRDAPRAVAYTLEQSWEEGTRFYLAFPLPSDASLSSLRQRGYARLLDTSDRVQVIELDDSDTKLPEAGLYVLQDRLIVRAGDEASATRIASSVQQAYQESGGHCLAVPAREGLAAQAFSERFEHDGIKFEEPSPHLFSFNSPLGACPGCQGLGRRKELDPDLVIPDPELSLRQGAIAPFFRSSRWVSYQHDLISVALGWGIDLDCPYRALPVQHRTLLWEGNDEYGGIRGFFEHLDRLSMQMQKSARVFRSQFYGFATCTDCSGYRLRPEALYVQVGGLHIGQVMELTIRDAHNFFETLTLTPFQENIAAILLSELRKRLRILVEVGLEYVTLDRPSRTLSGGENQRINLAASLGSSLVGSLYVLDEPTIGLHPRDTLRLIGILQRLRDLGNTVLVVEHDAEVMRHADEIVDLGPGSGHRGGQVTFQGSYDAMLQCEQSLTGRYLSHRQRIPVPAARRAPDWSQVIVVKGARMHNLKRITASFPLGLITVVTGVSGSGKSTLVHDTLYLGLRRLKGLSTGDASVGRHDEISGHGLIDTVQMVDQSPIGRSPRSNPATYTKAFDGIRQLFANTLEARLRGYPPGYFSFNVEGGRCDQCQGEGIIKVQMQFLADLYLECDECGGKRFTDAVLEIRYKGRNIDEVLSLTVDEAIAFFSDVNRVTKPLHVLSEIGLGYLKLGQPATTLSGGEAQRVKLATHVGARTEERMLYVFDEPTTGLHFDDIRKLLAAFGRLVDRGHTVVMVEHNIDVIKAADWVIDLGPEGGFGGGKIVAEGPPEVIARLDESHTAPFLRAALAENFDSAAVTF